MGSTKAPSSARVSSSSSLSPSPRHPVLHLLSVVAGSGMTLVPGKISAAVRPPLPRPPPPPSPDLETTKKQTLTIYSAIPIPEHELASPPG